WRERFFSPRRSVTHREMSNFPQRKVWTGSNPCRYYSQWARFWKYRCGPLFQKWSFGGGRLEDRRTRRPVVPPNR
ncbi:MAG: hypothetical protein ACOC82_03975, partial [Candidatus Bipolaricaulota bacterium]